MVIILHAVAKVMSYFEKQRIKYRIDDLELLEEQILCKWYGKNVEHQNRSALLKQLVKRPRVVHA